jgi:hypothetical protein
MSKYLYSPEKEGVDFLLSDIEGEVIPVEVGVRKKNTRQIKKLHQIIKKETNHKNLIFNKSNTRNKWD